ncbi:MAG: hypothetical protein RL398_1763 [Planctomycetota bacterium]
MGVALDRADGFQLREVRSPGAFLDLQREFYRTDPLFVPPVTLAEKWQVDRRKNPFFAHADVGLFALYDSGRLVGRMSTARDRLHDEFHGDRVGFFGHFEATSANAAEGLLRRAEAWCAARGADSLRGPVDLSTNYRCGLLIEGEPGLPCMMMPHNPPIYAEWIERAGLCKAKDLLALTVDQQSIDYDKLSRIAARLKKRAEVTLRPMNMRKFGAEAEILWDLYHRIWEKNWGFVPMSKPEFLRQATDLKNVGRAEFLTIAEIGDRPVGFVAALPDTNVGAKACDGRLLPLGWWKFLQAMKRVRHLRVITLGILPEFRNIGLEMMLIHSVVENGRIYGMDSCEASWILEDNRSMLGPLETLGFQPFRRYRIYEKQLR